MTTRTPTHLSRLAAGLFLAFNASLLSGCGGTTFLEVGTGANLSFTNSTHEWESGGSPAFYGAVRQEWELTDGLSTFLQYQHHSNIFTGPPFDEKGESSLDHIGAAVRWRVSP